MFILYSPRERQTKIVLRLFTFHLIVIRSFVCAVKKRNKSKQSKMLEKLKFNKSYCWFLQKLICDLDLELLFVEKRQWLYSALFNLCLTERIKFSVSFLLKYSSFHFCIKFQETSQKHVFLSFLY